jgi:hypothetical protein
VQSFVRIHSLCCGGGWLGFGRYSRLCVCARALKHVCATMHLGLRTRTHLSVHGSRPLSLHAHSRTHAHLRACLLTRGYTDAGR